MTWYALAFGALIGSFLNVCIFRIPERTFFKSQRSVCRNCGARVPAYLNVPIFSWLFLRGRTACCRSPLSVQYPLVEALTALMFAVLYWKYPFVSLTQVPVLGTDGGMAPLFGWDAGNLVRFGHAAVFVSLLIVCSVIDLRLMIIPDVISLPMVAATPLVIFVHPDLDWQSGLIGAAAGGLILYGIAWLYWLVRREVGMGMGDVKLLAAIGGWLGYQAIIPTILYGSLLGAVFGLTAVAVSRKLNLKSAIPFGPFLATGAIIHLLLGPFVQELVLTP
jgi:leader peptidase (prepilin peptidase)/N-methyltransferase